MSPFRSRLLWKAFLAVVLGLALWFPVFYWLTVPLVDRMAYSLEEKAARTVLDNLTEMVSQGERERQSWRATLIEAKRRELANIVQVAESWAKALEGEMRAGRISRAEARRQLLDRLRHVRYGNNDYLWVADYRPAFLAHPDKAFDGREASGLRNAQDAAALQKMVAQARSDGETYHFYRWKPLTSEGETQKLGYARNFPAWDFVVGTGVYVHDLEKELAFHNAAMLANLQRHLEKVQIAGSGNVLILDAAGDIAEGLNSPHATLPGGLVGADLVAAARHPDRTLSFQDRRPSDPDRSTGRQIAWVQPVPGQNLYLAAFVYRDDLERNGRYLSQRLLVAFFLGLVITAALALAFIRSLTGPILALASVARRAEAGDLAAVSDIQRNDEIGVLARAFNGMVTRLRDHIGNLEQRVCERTRDLTDLTEKLESEIEARTAQALASEAKFRSLLEQSLTGIFVIQDGVFRYVNSRFARNHGYGEAHEIVGLPLDRLLAPAEHEHAAELRRRFLNGEIVQCEVAFTGLRRDGSLVDLEVSAATIDYEGRPGVIGVAIDVTEKKRIRNALENHQQQLEEMVATRTAQLEAANVQLQAFTSAASHDLRAPLRGIQSFAFLLEKNYGERLADGDGATFLRHIQRSAARMGELIEDLLAHARMEQQDVRLEPIDLLAAVQGVLAERQEEIRQRAAEIRLELKEPALVVADPQGIAQALRNVVENALKYSGQNDQPLVEITCIRRMDTYCLAIRDNGIGFDMAYHDRIFEIFRRLHTYDEYPGSGVGLALVKKAMERMGGRVWAESEPGRGTTFFLEFRRAESEAHLPPDSLLMAA